MNMNKLQNEQVYLDALNYVRENGVHKSNRTGIDTISVWGYQMRFDLRQGFPLLTTKKMFWKGIVHELLWMIKGGDSAGNMNVNPLREVGVHIWNEWSESNGNLGPIYGTQWRGWLQNYRHKVGKIDQLQNAINTIRTNPNDRRIIVNSWNPSDLPEMKLPPCHLFYQFGCENNNLHMHMLMRSADLFLGVPFNIASYALLLAMVGQITDRIPSDLVISFSDLHLYTNHLEQVNNQLLKIPFNSPSIKFNEDCKEIDDFKYEDIDLVNYQSHPSIKGVVAI